MRKKTAGHVGGSLSNSNQKAADAATSIHKNARTMFYDSRPFDGKVFLWEHFGLMDQDEYRQKAGEKLVLYARHGFLPFHNLICTYEQDLQNPARIIELIDMYLLK